MTILGGLLLICTVACVALFGITTTVIGLCWAAFGGAIAIAITDAYTMARDPGLHSWPSVTTCRLCDRRIFAWQRYERRAMAVALANPDHLAIHASSSCLVHRRCHGTPTMSMGVRLGK